MKKILISVISLILMLLGCSKNVSEKLEAENFGKEQNNNDEVENKNKENDKSDTKYKDNVEEVIGEEKILEIGRKLNKYTKESFELIPTSLYVESESISLDNSKNLFVYSAIYKVDGKDYDIKLYINAKEKIEGFKVSIEDFNMPLAYMDFNFILACFSSNDYLEIDDAIVEDIGSMTSRAIENDAPSEDSWDNKFGEYNVHFDYTMRSINFELLKAKEMF